ncbi:MAG: zinc ribbon domain-containing protein [Lachnospiraceae bacterium]|nr:zinc ribbon domain-containing protein [Lachnospiraceae bacterium]
MFCPNCGTEIPNESTFCGTCGCRLQQNQGVQQVVQNAQQSQPEYGGQYVQQPQQMYNNQGVQQPQQMYYNPYAQQYSGAPVSHKRRNIIIISSVASAVVIALIIVLILVLGGDSFTGTWRASGFIEDNYDIIELNEFIEIADAQKAEEARREFVDLVLVINDDGTAQISEAGRTENGLWHKISETTIEVEGRDLILEDGHLSMYMGTTLKVNRKDGSGKIKLIGVYFE